MKRIQETDIGVKHVGNVLIETPMTRKHDAYRSTSCCLSQWPMQRDRANFDPTSRKPLITDETRKNYLQKATHQTIFDVSANTEFATLKLRSLSFYLRLSLFLPFFLIFGLFVTRTCRTGGPILTIYICTSHDVFLLQNVPVGVSLTRLPI